jgi:hypothetical protein
MQKFMGFPLMRIILAILFVGIGLVVTQLIISLVNPVISADNPIVGIGFTILALLAIYYAYYSYRAPDRKTARHRISRVFRAE